MVGNVQAMTENPDDLPITDVDADEIDPEAPLDRGNDPYEEGGYEAPETTTVGLDDEEADEEGEEAE